MRGCNEFINLIKSRFNNQTEFHLHQPIFSGNEKKYVTETIDSTMISSFGDKNEILQEKISNYTKSKYSLTCINGTSALHVSLILAGVKKEDEVLTQSLSFIATANAISYLNASPIFIDVDIETMGMCPVALEKFLNENALIKKDGAYNKYTHKKYLLVCLCILLVLCVKLTNTFDLQQVENNPSRRCCRSFWE